MTLEEAQIFWLEQDGRYKKALAEAKEMQIKEMLGFTEKEEINLLENYFEKKLSSELFLKYTAIKCASLLRETMWSMVSEITSNIDFDYSSYTAENLSKFNQAFNEEFKIN